ncbi:MULTISPECIES: hypothetical protein [unclassified Kitasatospora]|nr:hypothetical protein [Kitasatospora sp. RG8]
MYKLAPLTAQWPLVLTRTNSHEAADPADLRSRLAFAGRARA